jgi:hypothetical protein
VSPTKVAIVREPDDPRPMAKTSVSLGDTKDDQGFYIVFRGEPENVVSLLAEALKVCEVALPAGHYRDNRE